MVAGVNIGNSGLLFTRYLQGVTETLNQTSPLRQLAGVGDDRWTGSHTEFTVHVNRNPSIRYMEDGGSFPTPKKQGYVRAKAYRRFVGGKIQLSDGVLAAASGGRHIAKDVISSEVDGLMDNILKHENFFMSRDGTGVVATLQGTTVSGSTDIDVDDSRGLWETGVYNVYDENLTTNRGSVTISNLESAPDSSGNSLVNTVGSLPAGTTSGDKLVWAGSDTGSDSLNRAITGLDALINDSGTFQNVNTATYPKYTALVMDNSGTNRDLTPSIFRQLIAGMAQKTGSKKPTQGLKAISNAWQMQNVEELYEGELRLTPDTKTAGLALAAFQTAMGRVELLQEPDALYNKIFVADFSKIKRGVQKPLHWRKGKGGGIFLRSDTSAVYTATALEICELYIKDRHTSGKIEDLNETRSTAY